MAAELDNPIWNSLRTRHAAVARGDARALRYPADVAPFLGVPHDGTTPDEAALREAFDTLLPADDTVYLLGAAPRVPASFSLHAYPLLAQMVCEAPVAVPDGPAIQPLGAGHRDDVLALTALDYPHYFRPRTMELGRYFGIYLEGRLAAIVGERMATPACQEISAVCTHPDFLGRGLARRLLAFLGNDVLAQGRLPFLHVSHENHRAKELYERGGWRLRRDIGFWSLRR
jgi:ribosomal protein S18 acetylase RimI-like enzyme